MLPSLSAVPLWGLRSSSAVCPYLPGGVSPPGLCNGQEGTAGLLSCHQPTARWYLTRSHAQAPETQALLWVLPGSKVFAVKQGALKTCGAPARVCRRRSDWE